MVGQPQRATDKCHISSVSVKLTQPIVFFQRSMFNIYSGHLLFVGFESSFNKCGKSAQRCDSKTKQTTCVFVDSDLIKIVGCDWESRHFTASFMLGNYLTFKLSVEARFTCFSNQLCMTKSFFFTLTRAQFPQVGENKKKNSYSVNSWT